MKTKTGWAKDGFTIIEVMIFLAVSGFMFVLAAVFINGKQANVAFRQGIEAAASTVTNTIDTVANGEYPSLGNFSCNASGGGVSITTGNAGQGSNGGCIFLGKVLQFGTNAAETEYKTYTVAGRQYEAGSTDFQPVQSFADADPTAVTSPPWPVDLTQAGTLENGLTFSKIYRCSSDCAGGNADQISSVGFFGSFGSYTGGSPNSESSGAQSVTVAALPVGNTVPSDRDVLSNGQYVVLCFNYGNQVGSVTIGGQNGQQTSVSTDFNKDTPC